MMMALQVFMEVNQLGLKRSDEQRKRHCSSADGPHYLGVSDAIKFLQIFGMAKNSEGHASLKNFYFRQITWNYFANPKSLSLCEEDELLQKARKPFNPNGGKRSFIDFLPSLPTKRWKELDVEYYSPSISAKQQVTNRPQSITS